MPRGGARPGAGRKPKNADAAKLHGSRQRSVVRFPTQPGAAPVAGDVAREPVDVPVSLADDAALVWRELGPFAVAAGTLTAGTSAAFAMLCRAVVLERGLSTSRDAGLASHRGMMQRVEAGFVRFALAPMGKPIAKPKAEVDPFDEFDKAAGG